MVQWLRLVLQNIGFQVLDAPTPIYEWSQPKIDIIKSNHLTSIVKHISVPIHYFREKYVLITIDIVK